MRSAWGSILPVFAGGSWLCPKLPSSTVLRYEGAAGASRLHVHQPSAPAAKALLCQVEQIKRWKNGPDPNLCSTCFQSSVAPEGIWLPKHARHLTEKGKSWLTVWHGSVSPHLAFTWAHCNTSQESKQFVEEASCCYGTPHLKAFIYISVQQLWCLRIFNTCSSNLCARVALRLPWLNVKCLTGVSSPKRIKEVTRHCLLCTEWYESGTYVDTQQ